MLDIQTDEMNLNMGLRLAAEICHRGRKEHRAQAGIPVARRLASPPATRAHAPIPFKARPMVTMKLTRSPVKSRTLCCIYLRSRTKSERGSLKNPVKAA